MLGEQFTAPPMTGDRTLRERLAALAGFCPVFAQDAFRFADTTIRAKRDGDLIVFGGVLYGDQARRSIQTAYDYGWVRTLPWSEWRDTERGRHLMQNPEAMTDLNEDDLACNHYFAFAPIAFVTDT